MSKFNTLVENVMRVVLVPDETSDAVGQVQPSPCDSFSQAASEVMSDVGPEEAEGQTEPIEGEEIGEEEQEVEIVNDTDGVTINAHGISIKLSNAAVEKLKGVLGVSSGEGETEEGETEETEESEETETPEPTENAFGSEEETEEEKE